MNRLFRILLTLNATLLLVIVFFVQKANTLGYFFPNLSWIVTLPHFISYFAYLLVPVLLTSLSISLSPRLSKDEFKKGGIICIEHANNSFLPSYLGYFFVGLSINNWETLLFIYTILFVFTYKSQALYFNPLFLLFGYEFYNIKTQNGTTLFLISRKKYRNSVDVEIKEAYRINNYTFIEGGK